MPLLRELRRARHAAGGVLHAAARSRGATAHDVIWRRGPVALRRFSPGGETPRVETATPLLFVMPIINRWRVVDLDEPTSLIGRLVERGLTVDLIDWGDPRRIDGARGLDELVCDELPAALDAAGHERADVAGYCLGGTIASLFAARFPERVRRLVTINAPIDFAPMTTMRRWVDRRWFPVERLTAAFGNMPGVLVGQGFHWLRPVANALKGKHVWPRLDDEAFARFFFTLESWNADPVDVPGAAYVTLIDELYRENRLAEGRLRLRGEPVDLGRIDHPLLIITAKGDHICPPAAARALLDRVSTPVDARASLEVPGGHIAGVVGRKARATLHDPLADWLLS